MIGGNCKGQSLKNIRCKYNNDPHRLVGELGLRLGLGAIMQIAFISAEAQFLLPQQLLRHCLQQGQRLQKRPDHPQ